MVFWEERANIARSFSPSEGVAILIYACVSFIVHSFLLVRFFRSRYLGFLRRFINSPRTSPAPTSSSPRGGTFLRGPRASPSPGEEPPLRALSPQAVAAR